MIEKRPKVDYTMCWDCTFILDGKSEEITLMTDDFEIVFEEYIKMKATHKTCVFLKHELHRKGKLVMTAEMFGIPVEQAPIIDAEGRQERGFHDHNRDIAGRILREPPAHRI
jgi:hypothetical protein